MDHQAIAELLGNYGEFVGAILSQTRLRLGIGQSCIHIRPNFPLKAFSGQSTPAMRHCWTVTFSGSFFTHLPVLLGVATL